MKQNLAFLLNVFIFTSCVYNPPKEFVQIINTSQSDTIFVYSGHCNENLNSLLIPKKYYFSKGFNGVIRNSFFLDPLDTLNLSLGYSLLSIINSCNDKEAKVFIVKEISLKSSQDSFIKNQIVDTIFSLTENSIKNKIFYYKQKGNIK